MKTTKFVIAFLLVVLIVSLFISMQNQVERLGFQAKQFENPHKTREKTIPIVAVNSETNEGNIGRIKLRLQTGESDILIETNPFLGTDLQFSNRIAVMTAKDFTKNQARNVDFLFSYEIEGDLVGGRSAGAAAALVTIAALENKEIREKAAITGTITPDGSIGEVRGVLEKAQALANNDYNLFLVPPGQSSTIYYESTEKEHKRPGGFIVEDTHLMPKRINLSKYFKENYGMEVIEVSSIKEAAAIMLR